MKEKKILLFPVLVYVFHTLYLLETSIVFHWPSWVAATAIFGLVGCLALAKMKGMDTLLTKEFFACAVWMNLWMYLAYHGGVVKMFGTVAGAIVLLSLFDEVLVNYTSIFCTAVLFVLDQFVWNRMDLSSRDSVVTVVFQYGALFVIAIVEMMLLKSRIKQEADLDQTIEELKQAEHAKGDFMANISHEIRTPLNTICGIGNDLMEQKLDEQIRDDVFDIVTAGRNLKALVSDLLDFTELENETVDLVEEPYNLTSVINDAVNMAVAWNRDKKLELIVDCDANLPNSLLGDQQKIYRVIVNLLHNAVKFTDQGGVTLRITGRREAYGLNLMVSIEDTGIGIKEEMMEVLYSVYNQIDTSMNRRKGGVGLGLAISRRLISKMNGFLNIESEYGVGTKVTFVIPQTIVKDEPLVSIKPEIAKDIRAAYYLNLDKYQFASIRDDYLNCVQHIVDALHLPAIRCNNLREVKRRVERERITHLFVAQVEYLEDPEYFNSLVDQLTVILIVDDFSNRILPGRGVRVIYKPFHVFAVATILNGERLATDDYLDRWINRRFVVKDAKILAVDDNAMNLKVVDRLLRKYGIQITTVMSGEESLRMIEENHYDFVFMDHMMPGMDGVETLHEIRKLPQVWAKTMPVVALTANAVAGAREMLLAEGFDDFVAKPIEKSQLERVLHKYLATKIEMVEDEEDKYLIQPLNVKKTKEEKADKREGGTSDD